MATEAQRRFSIHPHPRVAEHPLQLLTWPEVTQEANRPRDSQSTVWLLPPSAEGVQCWPRG